jgi:hypothetical protein
MRRSEEEGRWRSSCLSCTISRRRRRRQSKRMTLKEANGTGSRSPSPGVREDPRSCSGRAANGAPRKEAVPGG